MIPGLSHHRDDESIEAKARWFPSLTLQERMDLLCEFTEMFLAINPKVAQAGRAQSSTDRVRVLSLHEAC